jgi:hypothetical protein
MISKAIDIEDLLETPDNPQFIPGVFNYCQRQCERCPFTERRRLYADERLDVDQHPDDDWITRMHRSFQRTMDMLKAWCEREGVDFEALQKSARSEAEPAESRLIEEARQDPLLKLAEQYTHASFTLTKRLYQSAQENSWPQDAREALDTIAWFAMRVSSKIHRALTGIIRRLEEDGDDPLQTDWNGSAKVARLDIAESRAAWETLLKAGRATSDSPMRQLIELLDRIDSGVAERFPHAMEFVRPGFDEPDVAAGAVSTKASFESRTSVENRAL